VEFEITPEPPPELAEALRAALARALSEREEAESAWWREGVRENLTEAPGEPPDATP
jgi:hypothetical protein